MPTPARGVQGAFPTRTPRSSEVPQEGGIPSLDKREPHLGLLASCLEAAAPPLQQKALLPLPPAENPTYVITKNLTPGFHSYPERDYRAPAGVHRRGTLHRQAIWCGWGSRLHISPRRLRKKTHLPYSDKLRLAGLLFLPCRLG